MAIAASGNDPLAELLSLLYDRYMTLNQWVVWVQSQTGKQFIIRPSGQSGLIMTFFEAIPRGDEIELAPLGEIPIRMAESWFASYIQKRFGIAVPPKERSSIHQKADTMLRLSLGGPLP